MSKCFERVTKTIINEENLVNGELKNKTKKTEEKKYYIQTEGEDDFIKLYIKHISAITEMPGSYPPILLELLKYMSYSENGQRITIDPIMKKEICEKVGISLDRLNHSINEFSKKEILIRLCRGVYQVNPHIFGKGTWNNIKKLRLTIDYNPDFISLKTTITKDKPKKKTISRKEEFLNIV